MINGHGNDLHHYQGKIIADFSSNVWYQGTPKPLLKHMQTEIKSIENYPEPDASSLAQKTETFYQLPAHSCQICNGSVEAFYLLAQAFNNNTATIITPTFAEYADACKMHNIKVSFFSNSKLKPDLKFSTQLVWLCNPNNPDGKITPISTIKTWLTNNPQSIFIIDEAYAELCFGFKSAIALLHKYQNLIICKSFTKAFAIPGIRLGFILSNKSIIKQIKQFQLPWAVNSLALSAGSYIINNYAKLLFSKNKLQHESNLLQQHLSNIPNIELTPSECNFFLVKTLHKDAAALKKYLANKLGLLIRDASNFQGLSKGHFRIAIQSKQKNKLLINAITEWVQL